MDHIANALNIRPLSEALPAVVNTEIKTTEVVKHEEVDKRFAEDYEFARNNIRDSIEQAKAMFGKIVEFSLTAPESRKFEVAAGMLNSIVAANESLLELNRSFQSTLALSQPKIEETNNITNNNLIVDSNEMLEKARQAIMEIKALQKSIEPPSVVVEQDAVEGEYEEEVVMMEEDYAEEDDE